MKTKLFLILCFVASIASGYHYYQYKVPYHLKYFENSRLLGVVNIDDIVAIEYINGVDGVYLISLKNSKELEWYENGTHIYNRAGELMIDSPMNVVD